MPNATTCPHTDRPAKSHGRCGSCDSAERYRANPERGRAAAARWRSRNPEAHKAAYTEWRKRNPEQFREATNRWHRAHPDKLLPGKRRWRELNPEKQRASSNAWKKANPDAVRSQEHRRRAKLVGNGVYAVTRRDLERLSRRFRGNCAYCGSPATTIDHVVPIARGGRHAIGNLVPSCGPCNFSKNASYVVEWRARKAAAA